MDPPVARKNRKERKEEENDGLESEGWTSEEEEKEPEMIEDEEEKRRKKIKERETVKRRDLQIGLIEHEVESAEKDEMKSQELRRKLEGVGKESYWKDDMGTALSETQVLGECLFALEGLSSVLFERERNLVKVSNTWLFLLSDPHFASLTSFRNILSGKFIF